jgi:hypothetical protein
VQDSLKPHWMSGARAEVGTFRPFELAVLLYFKKGMVWLRCYSGRVHGQREASILVSEQRDR